MRRANDDVDDMTGQDSFLDVIANIVGILILLVMVMGVRAAGSDKPEPPADPSPPTEQQASAEDLEAVTRAAFNAESDVRRLVEQAVGMRQEMLLREQERLWLNTYVAAADKDLEQRRSALSVEEQRDFDLRRDLSGAQQTLDDLTREQVSLLSQVPEIQEIEHLPTPLAQTVSGKEVHLRIYDGLVAYLPIDELLNEFKSHAEANVWRLRDQNSVVSTIGPIEGFRLRYRLARVQFSASTPSGLERQGTAVRLVKWELIPTAPRIGEPTAQALLPTSDLRRSLARFQPQATTITIWTYPGSFNDYRTLKKMLFELGYATAARPLPEGFPIGGSPSGSKSAAQ